MPAAGMPVELVFRNGRRICLSKQSVSLGRADLPSCAEGIFVSRKQCLVTLLDDGTPCPRVQLQHTGSANPILIRRHLADGDAADLLQPGEQAVLQPRDSFSILCTQPDLAIMVQEGPQAPTGPAAHQMSTLQPTAAEQAQGLTSSCFAEVGGGGRLPPAAAAAAAEGQALRTRMHPSQPLVASAAAADGGQMTGGMPSSGARPQAARPGAPPSPQQQQQQQQQQSVGRQAQAPKFQPIMLPPEFQPIMLLLVGVPGSGKSTFSQQLQQRSGLPWVRVNQDVVKKKSGKREVCEQQAVTALRSRQCVLIDRCHVTPDQRQHFIQLARAQGARCHVLVLALPAVLCRQRAAGRSKHEGGVQGPGAVRVVGMMQGMFDKAGPPQVSEGIDSITICRNDAHMAAALAAWASFGTPATAAATAAAAAGVGGGGSGGKGLGGPPSNNLQQPPLPPQQQQLQGAGGSGGLVSEADVLATLRHLQPAAPSAAAATSRSAGQQTLPSSTAAAAAAAAAATAGLAMGGVQSSAEPGRSKRPKVTPTTPPPPQQQQQPVGGVTPPGLSPGQKNAFAVLMRGSAAAAAGGSGGGTSSRGSFGAQQPSPKALPSQQQQQQQTRPQQQTGSRAGWNQVLAQVARDPAAHMSSQTIFYVDPQVVGMVDGYPKAHHYLLFVARDPGLQKASDLTSQHLPLLAHLKAVACYCISPASKGQLLGTGRLLPPLQQQQAGTTAAASAGGAGSGAHPSMAPSSGPGQAQGGAAAAGGGSWAAAGAGEEQMGAPTAQDVPQQQQQRQEEAGQQQQQQQQQEQGQVSPPEGWMLGFHSIPSMTQLHLHALTKDLCSPCIKHKKHWNSFTTAFFLPLDRVVEQLERAGVVAVDVGAAEALLKGPLVCQVCGQVLGNMPALKQHVQAHFP